MSLQVRIDLVYDQTCPHVDQARAAIRDALEAFGVPCECHEWERNSGSTPAELRGLGSPSVLIDGRDVGGEEAPSPTPWNSCRIYRDESGHLSGAPSMQVILDALRDAENRLRRLSKEERARS